MATLIEKLRASVEATDKLLNSAQAAEFLGIKPQTLNVWRCAGRYDLPYIRVGDCIRYRLSDLEKWLESRTVNAK